MCPQNIDGTSALSNEQKFEHMIKFQYRRHGHKQVSGKTLGINISIQKRQMECIQLTNVNLRKVRILAGSGVEGEILNILWRKLDSLGYIKFRWSLLTDDLFQPKTDLFSTRTLIWVHFKTMHNFSQPIFSLLSYLENAYTI